MEFAFDTFPLWLWGFAVSIAFVAGLVKGVVGFALPLILVSGLGAVTSPELALAGLIFPTLVTNLMQAFRLGVASAVQATHNFRWFLCVGGVALILAAQMVSRVPEQLYLLMLGVPIVIFILTQLAGWRPTQTVQSVRLDAGVGMLAGFFGGIAGVWGPPTVAYLTALNTPKQAQMQIQGVIYLSGAVALVGAHLMSGILTRDTILFSCCLVIPAMLGMMTGTAIQDRINQTTFRRATLFVLLLAGLNLVRRGVLA